MQYNWDWGIFLQMSPDGVHTYLGTLILGTGVTLATALSVLGYLVWVQPFIASFAVVIYLPQLVIVPSTQRGINRFARSHAKPVRSRACLRARYRVL